jgi:hypothetical protein
MSYYKTAILLRASLIAISDNWNHLMRLRDGLKHQRENKHNSDKKNNTEWMT